MTRDAPINLPHGGGKSRLPPARTAICQKATDASCSKGVFARPPVLSAQLAHTHQLFSSHPEVRQGEPRGRLNRVFHQPTKAHSHVPKMAFDHPKRMLNLSSCLSFAVFDLALSFVQ
jgi:hypothetical protein